ncbi:MAG: enoyl-CoA hydratase [Actinomycetia bacterium]|nr:enoyl-CoA hydratase [Actinomycetes bacterium]MCP5030690.1 enoyl-CoA hydratase [Actinomycetes bacterium]
MTIKTDAVGAVSGPKQRSWTSTDALLYALGVGAGMDDPTGAELEFTTENSRDVAQRVLPTMGVVMQASGLPLNELGDINLAMLLHGEQGITLHREIPVEGTLASTSTITGIWDKTKGAVVDVETSSVLVDDGEPLFTTRTSLFLRGEGGWGGDRGPSVSVDIPDSAPDLEITYRTRIDQALLYRLNGDRNPLHSDPLFAADGGFPKPILHGLCTYGFTGRALLNGLCDGDPGRFGSMDARFTSPVMPGETLTVRIWRTDDGALFRTHGSDDRVVLDAGRFSTS